MALLTLEKRKKYFKKLGLGEYNKKNILRMQKKYMLRDKDYDGIYGKDTDTLLRHLYNCWRVAPSFDPKEFRCQCHGRFCCGFPTRMKVKELKHLQAIRDHYKKPMIITSGLRCRGFNAELSGSSTNSRHLTGYACDFYMQGVTDTLANRKKAVRWIKRLKNHHYTYGNGINSYGYEVYAPNMGNALHTDTR